MAPTHHRPRLDASKPRRAPGIVLTDVPDQRIIALLDAGLSRLEIGQHFGVADHIIRYRIRVMRDRKILAEGTLPYRRFFVDVVADLGGHPRFYMIPAHRRGAWNALKGMDASQRPAPPLWAMELSDFSLLEFSTPKSFGAYARAA